MLYSRQDSSHREQRGAPLQAQQVYQHLQRRQGPADACTSCDCCKEGSPPEVSLLACSTTAGMQAVRRPSKLREQVCS